MPVRRIMVKIRGRLCDDSAHFIKLALLHHIACAIKTLSATGDVSAQFVKQVFNAWFAGTGDGFHIVGTANARG